MQHDNTGLCGSTGPSIGHNALMGTSYLRESAYAGLKSYTGKLDAHENAGQQVSASMQQAQLLSTRSCWRQQCGSKAMRGAALFQQHAALH